MYRLCVARAGRVVYVLKTKKTVMYVINSWKVEHWSSQVLRKLIAFSAGMFELSEPRQHMSHRGLQSLPCKWMTLQQAKNQ